MTFKIGDKVRYNKAAEVYGWSEKGAVFKVTARVGGDAYRLEGEPDEVHEEWLEKVEEEYGVGDIICARKGKEIVQGSLVRRRGGNLGFAPSGQIGSSDLAQWYQNGWSIVATDSANSPEPESSYVLFTDAKGEPFLSYKIAPNAWVTQDYEDEWAETLEAFGPGYVELVQK